jgi:hydrogenase maturation protein HypF
LSGQPIIFDDVEIKKFGVPVLWFNRKIARPIEDSVVRIIAEKPQIIRRAKGFAPLPVSLKTNKKILAMGGDLKACFAICDGENAFLSPYIGDLEERKTFDLYKKTLQEYFSLFDFFPEIIVCDLHPAYISTQYAENFSKEFGLPLEKVQHHKAHIASAMAEFNLENCIGVSYDGTGYGDDGNIWGGEIFSIKNNEFIRHWHFPYVKYLKGCEQDAQLVSFAHHPNFAPEIVRKALNCDINTYYSSSVGRLFDKFGFENYGFRYNSFEGEIANKIEQSAQYNNDVIDFFDKISEITAKQCNETFLKTGINNIVLTGGCFQNKILIEKIKENLYNFNIYINQKVPVNDGGICLGQAYIVRNL